MKKVKESVDEINEILIESDPSGSIVLEYSEMGYVESVNLHIATNNSYLELHVWSSETEDREWDESAQDYTPFKDLLLKRLNDAREDLSKASNNVKSIK